MNRVIGFGKTLTLMAAIGLLTYSCSKDSDKENQDEQLSSTELKTILETDDVAGSIDTVLADIYTNSSSSSKGSNDCYATEYTNTGFTVVFENCVLNGSDNVNGNLEVTYAADEENASFTATYTNFFVGEIELNGTRTYEFDANSEEGSYTFSVTSNMSVTMEDDTTISENGTKTFGFTFGTSLETSTFTIDGNWTVVADGNTYSVEVTSILEGNFGCGYLTSGIMDVSKNGLEVSVDFGDGSCDDIVTVIYPNGATEDISVKD